MAKPDPILLAPARYPFVCEIPTRFADLDTNMHLNNAALASILEDARVRFHAASDYHIGREGWTAMVANLTIDYLGQGFYPAPVSVHIGATSVGRTSYSLAQLVRQGDAIVALARSVMVCVKDDRPFPLPDAFRESVKPWMFQA
ncbi:MAG: thioesterase family protein [Novosphingobium sp.]